MSILDRIHGGYVHGRRVHMIASQIAPLFSSRARVLDVGCGDGLIAAELRRHRPDVEVTGIDVLVRPTAHVPVAQYDGRKIPYADGAFDSVLFVDVLHHTHDPFELLREARRVARSEVVLKDHTMDGPLSGPILRFMDHVGNDRHGVESVYNYWPSARWRDAFRELDLELASWREPDIYPFPASLVFGRGLHFMAKLLPRAGSGSAVGD